MSSSSHPNAWQTAGRGGRQQLQQHHQLGLTSRTPQNRSSNASPSQSQQHSAPPPALPKQTLAQQQQQQQQQQAPQEARPPVGNAWTQRQVQTSHSNLVSPSAANAGNGSIQHTFDAFAVSERTHAPLHGFNAVEVKAFLAREPALSSYKAATPAVPPTTTPDAPRNSGGAWGAKVSPGMTNQGFFIQLAKQVATFEDGG
ncbi:uncharacterized protein K489DRAFT_14218 [Dissoconium aciculare CBS 342.82]|uniref:Uncharacterized protein n=1 Tax=Dissoconium aciculare CBS 342.82 TaxID=1314786 RepID=A0A6J3MHL8_9PEZI|nr:uncharacterized protein K489DRAFT_14218 [Dissoconium aciculare CBS 342.82]KAF1827378.1 hypothetical protein K489DRAFT_14218 [Dissoconium aciculare CBS 342.82]